MLGCFVKIPENTPQIVMQKFVQCAVALPHWYWRVNNIPKLLISLLTQPRSGEIQDLVVGVLSGSRW